MYYLLAEIFFRHYYLYLKDCFDIKFAIHSKFLEFVGPPHYDSYSERNLEKIYNSSKRDSSDKFS